LHENPLPFTIYGSEGIEDAAMRQMELAMRLPVTINGALMADAHAGYGLPIGGVLAVNNAVIPYAVGVDIGCQMSLSLFDAKPNFLKRYTQPIIHALEKYTHFGMEGGLPFAQDHEVLHRKEFEIVPIIKKLHAKAQKQLGSSGGGNHFVEFGNLTLMPDNILGLPEGDYVALLSHSGSRGMGAVIARHYYEIALDICKLPRVVQHFAWLSLDSEAGQEYWLAMTLAGDYAHACHEQIHRNLGKALGIKAVANVNNIHNFAWKEIISGTPVVVHRKGATPASQGQAGFIPGSMTTAGYLVSGNGVEASLNSASHGAGRRLSREQAREQFTLSAMKKLLVAAGVVLVGGSVEESPTAYKDIDTIMLAQESLVNIHGKFMPKIVRMNNK
jgi:tRNA-splicing ligase RtcB